MNSIAAFEQEDVQLVMEVSQSSVYFMTVFLQLTCTIHKAVSESLALKQKIFSELAARCSPETILATNTSSISIAKIAASAVAEGSSAEERSKSSSRVLGIHWMNPVRVSSALAEIVN